jgi:hypothetical protein
MIPPFSTPGKRLVFLLRRPLGDDFVAAREAAHVHAVRFAGPQPKQALLGA